jgi:hypothetical protein
MFTSVHRMCIDGGFVTSKIENMQGFHAGHSVKEYQFRATTTFRL